MTEPVLSQYKRETLIAAFRKNGIEHLEAKVLPPYMWPKNGPDIFKGSNGPFTMPQPTGPNGFYVRWVIDDILKANDLEGCLPEPITQEKDASA